MRNMDRIDQLIESFECAANGSGGEACNRGKACTKILFPRVCGERVDALVHGSPTGKPPSEPEDTSPGLYMHRRGRDVVIVVLSVFVSTVVTDGALLLRQTGDGRWKTVVGSLYTYMPGVGIRHYTEECPEDRYGSIEDAENVVTEAVRQCFGDVGSVVWDM